MQVLIQDEILFQRILTLKKEYFLSKKAFHKLTGIRPDMQDRMEMGDQVILDYSCLDRICRVFGETKRELLMGLSREKAEGGQTVCLVRRDGFQRMSGYDPLWEMRNGLAQPERFTVTGRGEIKLPRK